MRSTLIALTLLFALAAAFLWANRPFLVTFPAEVPDAFPQNGFSHRPFEALLERYVDDSGNVAYHRWHDNAADVAQLDAYLAAVARYSPDATPERFPSRADELAYWIYAYNAYVIRCVLAHWPISSVTDVKAPIEVVRGLGFFYRHRFLFGGESLSLLTVENRRIRERYRDPRIHFVLSCASDSCPVLRPTLPAGEALEDLLADATRDFVTDTANVAIDPERRVITLSPIFQMYESDFVNALRASGRPARSVLDYVRHVAPDELRTRLDGIEGYRVEFREFDWALNASET